MQVMGDGDCLPESILQSLCFHETNGEALFTSLQLRRQVVIWIAK